MTTSDNTKEEENKNKVDEGNKFIFNRRPIDEENDGGTSSVNSSLFYPADGLTIPAAYDVIHEAVTDSYENLQINSENLKNGSSSVELVPVTLTSRKELLAWWMYFFSYSPVSAVAMVLLIPLLLQDLGKRYGHVFGHTDQPCTDSTQNCIIWTIGSWSITPSAFAYYIIGLSVAAQAITFISVGALADYGKLRKGLLSVCTWFGGFSAISMVFVSAPSLIWLAGLMTIILNIFYGTASVFYNAYLPLLVQNHPKYLAAAVETTAAAASPRTTDQDAQNQNSTTITFTASQRRLHKVGEKLSSFISTVGMASGYSAGIIVIFGVILYFRYVGAESRALQNCIAICGLWWLVFSSFSLWNLKYRPGPPLPDGSNYVLFSWRKLMKTIQKCRKLPTTFSFLICYFFYSDGFNTMGSAAILIARQSMNVEISKLIICALIAPICALFGTISFLFIQRIFKISSKSMLISILLLMGCIPIYCSLGLVSNRIGLRQEWEIYLITSVYGLIIGAAQSFSRVLFAELIPVGDESEFFSLYAITDKGSAFLGPLVIAILSDTTDEPRYGLLFLAILILTPIPFIIKYVNLTKGKHECRNFIQSRHPIK